MRDHVRILGWLNIALGALGLLGAIVVFFVFGGIAGIVGIAAYDDPDAVRVAIPVLGVLGTVIPLIIGLLSLPGIVVGWGLIRFQSWAHILGIILSALNLLHVPLGTLLGVYGLWVLLQQETERLFAPPAAAPQA
ncbi:MAG: hypothetical protein ACUVXB_07125 [Bryobacteraceae bacterium]